jgi:hypothetical protein
MSMAEIKKMYLPIQDDEPYYSFITGIAGWIARLVLPLHKEVRNATRSL